MSFWDTHQFTIDRENFRGNRHYLGVQDSYPYREMTQLVRSLVPDWLEALQEDGAFGAVCEDVDGAKVSRDLLDSILELYFLTVSCGLPLANARVLDIGAGYGRLAHRLLTRFPDAFVACTDMVSVSSELCAQYLKYRGLERAAVVSTGEIDGTLPLDLAVNIHSWPECKRVDIAWWLSWLSSRRVPNLFVIPHPWEREFCCLDDGRSFLPEITHRGYRLRHHWRPLESFPRDFYLFQLEAP